MSDAAASTRTRLSQARLSELVEVVAEDCWAHSWGDELPRRFKSHVEWATALIAEQALREHRDIREVALARALTTSESVQEMALEGLGRHW